MKYSKTILKTFLVIICSFGLLYQTSQLMRQYLSGKTVVNLEVKRLHNEKIPGITICYPQGLSIKRIAEFFGNDQELYIEYSKLDKMLTTFPRTINQTTIDLATTKIRQIFFEILRKKELKGLTAHQLLANFSIPYHYINQNNPFVKSLETTVIFISFSGIANPFRNYSKFKLSDENTEPIESLSLYGYSISTIRKCFTFFSSLSLKWRNFTMNLDYLSIRLEHSNSWSPSIDFEEYYLSIHSPNTLPELTNDENFIVMNASKDYSVTYSQINTELLDSGYDTNCFKYDLDYKHANNMRSDCFTSCYLENIKPLCNDKIPDSSQLLRKEFLDYNRNDTFLYNYCVHKTKHFEIQTKCSRQCKFDCKFSHYLWDIKVKSEWTGDPFVKSGMFQLKHNRMPDILIKHLPETTLISFVCSFGGLLGMWLGLNILVIFDSTINVINKLIVVQQKHVNKTMIIFQRKFNKFFNKRNLSLKI